MVAQRSWQLSEYGNLANKKASDVEARKSSEGGKLANMVAQ